MKSQLIIKCAEYKESIFALEDTNFCQGRIDFVFYCLDYENDLENFNLDLSQKLLKVLKLPGRYITNDFRRALLTIPDENDRYGYYDYWWSWSYAVNAHKRC